MTDGTMRVSSPSGRTVGTMFMLNLFAYSASVDIENPVDGDGALINSSRLVRLRRWSACPTWASARVPHLYEISGFCRMIVSACTESLNCFCNEAVAKTRPEVREKISANESVLPRLERRDVQLTSTKSATCFPSPCV